MEETFIVIMIKNTETGFLEKEFASFSLPTYENLITNIYATQTDDKMKIVAKVSTGFDVLDWQFNAIFDYYDEQILQQLGVDVTEDLDCFNPTWQLEFDCPAEMEDIENKIFDLLKVHNDEIVTVMDAIKDKADEYK